MSDANWIIDLVKYSPVPVACLVVIYKLVHLFLRHLEVRDKLLKTLGDSCHEVQRSAIEAINRTTQQMGRVEVMLTRMNGVKL